MVFNEPRLPGVLIRRVAFVPLYTAAGRRRPGDARHLGLKPKHIPSDHTGRGIRNARHLDLSPLSGRCYAIRAAAPSLPWWGWPDAGPRHDARRAVTPDAT